MYYPNRFHLSFQYLFVFFCYINSYISLGRLRRGNSNNNLNRPHTFSTRTTLKPGGETCAFCTSRISFGKLVYKCNTCLQICHEKCKDKLPLPCMAPMQTPSKKTKVCSLCYFTEAMNFVIWMILG